TAGQRVKLGSDSTQRFAILGAQTVQAMLVSVLVDEQSNHLFSNPLLEPFSTQAQLVEHQLTGWPIGSCSKMMRRRTKPHDDLARQDFLGDPPRELGDLSHPVRPL